MTVQSSESELTVNEVSQTLGYWCQIHWQHRNYCLKVVPPRDYDSTGCNFVLLRWRERGEQCEILFKNGLDPYGQSDPSQFQKPGEVPLTLPRSFRNDFDSSYYNGLEDGAAKP